MSQHQRSSKTPESSLSVIAVGTFDGVHLGHKAVLERVKTEATLIYGRSIALTFDKHPLAQVRPGAEPPYLTNLDEKVSLLRMTDVDEVSVLSFDAELSTLEPEGFLNLLVERWGCACLVMGYDNAFGKGRIGTPSYMRPLAHQMGIELVVVGPIEVDGVVVSSTEIRRSLAEGDVTRAGQLLGRVYSLESFVEHGDGRGRSLGFPTANLDIPKGMVIPAGGVYATWAVVGGRRYPSVTNIGVRPTFYAGREERGRSIETHLLVNEGVSIYGHPIKIEFAQYLRKEIAFSSVHELKQQISCDVEKAKAVLGLT